ncbi:NAD-dependent epimerase/dehydratase family protein [Halorussus caseinilyticus]|uniref:NAD-dependent epimerase/dehydratase family protein n=1 Tax=Halorussus caseinilyticus TaxID=3034025 RepID=A0ABD5WT92_9EURY
MSVGDELSSRTVLVTGAGGFFGGHVASRLSGVGAEVHSIHHSEPSQSLPESPHRRYVGDVTDEQFLDTCFREARPEYVYHLAAKTTSRGESAGVVETNVTGTKNVFEKAVEHDAEGVVFTSSAYRYADTRTAKTESHPVAASSLYDASKRSGERLARSYSENEGLSVAVAVPFLVYGPRQTPAGGLIPSAIASALEDESFRVRCTDHVRDPVFVGDAVDALLNATIRLADDDWMLFNVCGGTGMTAGEMVGDIYELVGADARPTYDHAAECEQTASHLVGDPSHAAELLDWKPTTSWRDGLRRTVEAARRESDS